MRVVLTTLAAGMSGDRIHCFFDIAIDGKGVGRIVFEVGRGVWACRFAAKVVFCQLYTDVTPLTCDNFRALCTGEKVRRERGG